MHPSSFVMMMLFVTITEGYCLYAFFALVTANLGGPKAVVESIEKSGKSLLCYFCLPAEPVRFYRWTNWALFHLIALRGVISMISALCFYAGTKAGRQAYVVYNFRWALVLLFGLVCLVNLCKYSRSCNFYYYWGGLYPFPLLLHYSKMRMCMTIASIYSVYWNWSY